MSERDWEKDWELCQRTKQRAEEIRREGWLFMEIPREYRLEVGLHSLGFMEEALEGWPAALEERARLEKRVKKLNDLLDRLLTICAEAGIAADTFSEADCRNVLRDIDRVWREVFVAWTAKATGAYGMEQTLAALEGGSENV